MKETKQTPVGILDISFPETYEIERQVLADVVTAPETMGDVFPLLHPDFFTSPERRGMWETIVEQYDRGRDFGLATMAQLIGEPFMREVLPKTSRMATTTEAIEHASLLRTGAARRRVYIAGAEIIRKSADPSSSELDLLSAAEGFAAQVEGPAPVLNELSIAEAIQGVRKEVQDTQRAAAEGRAVRIPSGFETLDRAINNGFKPGQLVVLAARPNVGKTSVMLHLAKNAARAGFPVYISTLEMTGTELGEKFIYSTGNIRPAEIAYGNVDWTKFDDAASELSGLPIWINQFSRTLDEIVARITQAVKRGACRIAMIDYLGLVQDTNNLGGGAKLYQIIAKITGTLKAVAKRLGIPILLLCQLNREQVRDKRSPELYDLRDSGSIEQDADIVIMLEDEWRDNGVCITAWLRKNRGGRRRGARGGDLGFILIPNETYSAFQEGGVINEDDDTAGPKRTLLGATYGTTHAANTDPVQDDPDLPF